MGHTSGLCEGFILLGLAVLIGIIVWPPFAFYQAKASLKKREYKSVLFLSVILMFQFLLPTVTIVWFLL